MPDPGPHRLTETRAIFDAEDRVTTKSVTPSFYAELDQEFGDFRRCVLVQQHRFEAAWPTWEMHPEGDELVYLLDGDADLVLRFPDGDRTLRMNEVGSYVVVPKGVWHTARPHAPTTMLFVTPGEGTRNEETPPA